MSNFNVNHVLVAVLITLCLSQVQGANLPELKKVYEAFFNGLDEICGNVEVIKTARQTYNGCAEAAENYQALITCATTAFETYDSQISPILHQWYKKIMALNGPFLQGIMNNTKDEPSALRKIPITEFTAMVALAHSMEETSRSERERI